MKAVVLNEARAPELREIAEPEPAAGQVLLEVDHCGICGTDLHAATLDVFRPGVVMGHEFSATIAELGPDVDGWRVGDRVRGGADRPAGDGAAPRRGSGRGDGR